MRVYTDQQYATEHACSLFSDINSDVGQLYCSEEGPGYQLILLSPTLASLPLGLYQGESALVLKPNSVINS